MDCRRRRRFQAAPAVKRAAFPGFSPEEGFLRTFLGRPVFAKPSPYGKAVAKCGAQAPEGACAPRRAYLMGTMIFVMYPLGIFKSMGEITYSSETFPPTSRWFCSIQRRTFRWVALMVS